MTAEERVARAICKSEMSDVGIFGAEICCQFAPASQRFEGGENLERCCWKDSIDTARAVIEELMAALADEGLVIRPQEPTEAMERAGVASLPITPGNWLAAGRCAGKVYRAMIAEHLK